MLWRQTYLNILQPWCSAPPTSEHVLQLLESCSMRHCAWFDVRGVLEGARVKMNHFQKWNALVAAVTWAEHETDSEVPAIKTLYYLLAAVAPNPGGPPLHIIQKRWQEMYMELCTWWHITSYSNQLWTSGILGMMSSFMMLFSSWISSLRFFYESELLQSDYFESCWQWITLSKKSQGWSPCMTACHFTGVTRVQSL